jgi:hypothetical protein
MMPRALILHPGLLLLAMACAVSTAIAADAVPAATTIKHRFAILDNGANRLVLVDQQFPERSWSVPVPSGARDLQRLGTVATPASRDAKPDPLQQGEPRILVSHPNGAGEYAIATGKLLWSVKGQAGVSTARRLPDGNTMLGADHDGVRLITVDPAGTVVSTIPVECKGDLRLIRTAPGGHVLLGLAKPNLIVEVDDKGTVVKEFPLPGKGYIAERLPNGDTLAATGAALSVVELDPTGKVVRTIGGKTGFPDARFLWFSSFDQLPDGHLMVANWCGHGHEGKGPHLLEFDADNHLIWQWEDHQLVRTATSVLALDER